MFVSNGHDLTERLRDNPIVTVDDVTPSDRRLEVIGAFNPAAFEYKGRIALLLRIAERPHQEQGFLTVVRRDGVSGRLRFRRFRCDDGDLDTSDPRLAVYRGVAYLTSISHFRLAWSTDGVRFAVDGSPTIEPEGIYETFGIEDARVTRIGKTYYITYSAVSEHEVAIAMITTTDWRRFNRAGPILQPFNKDACVFSTGPRRHWLIHRPSGVLWKRNWMWISRSSDLIHWGRPMCLARTRPGKFDSERIGAGGPPIGTENGHLLLYHGADRRSRYCLAAMLLDRSNPARVVARSETPILRPTMAYERGGFFGNVVFSDAAIRRDDQIWIYYAAADTVTCLARVQLKKLLRSLRPSS